MERIRKMLVEMNGIGDMTEEEITIIEKVANGNYEGVEEDREYLEEKLEEKSPDWNLQTVYDILSDGEWYYMN